MKKPPEEFFELCRLIGEEVPRWTQGAGGNVSCKDAEGTLWIKASGVRLDSVSLSSGYAATKPRAIREALAIKAPVQGALDEQGYADLLAQQALPIAPGHPSMETGFHAALAGKFVCHFHSIASLLMAHVHQNEFPKWDAWIRKSWTQSSLQVLPLIRPGLELSQELAAPEQAEVIILKNHGVILQFSGLRLLTQWRDLEDSFLREWNFPIKAKGDSCLSQSAPLKIYFPDTAVFLDRLKKILVVDEAGLAKALPEAQTLDKNTYEIWWASCLLYALCPGLDELPESISSGLAGLPTEVFRRKIASGASSK